MKVHMANILDFPVRIFKHLHFYASIIHAMMIASIIRCSFYPLFPLMLNLQNGRLGLFEDIYSD